jgi:ParB family chromosome partitioning protein
VLTEASRRRRTDSRAAPLITTKVKSFRDAANRIVQQESGGQPGVISLLAARTPTTVRDVPIKKVQPNPNQPRITWHEETIRELAASIREHGVLQPVLVRPAQDGRYQLIAGERRWRAARQAGLSSVPAIIEQIDDETALEIALIENLQREDLSPLDEAVIYKKMTDELGYSIRSLADKLSKDKGYVENRLRLATAPEDVREMVAQRHDTLAAAYELMKVEDRRRRKALERRIVEGRLTLLRLRERIDRLLGVAQPKKPAPPPAIPPLRDDSLIAATRKLNESLVDLARVVAGDGQAVIGETDRENLAKFLTISRTRLDNLVTRLRLRAAR